ncbi:hypothetical protein PO909_028018 [Leuciscus waleckii]
MEGESVTLKPVTEINKGDQIQWIKTSGDKDTLIAEIKGGTGEIITSDGRIKGGVELDKTTGSLTITNTRTEDTGLYKILIRRGIRTLYEEFYIVVNDRLKLDKKTGSLTIMNTRNTDTGLYELKISQDSKIKYKMFNISVCGEYLTSLFF